MSPERILYPRSEKARNLINFLYEEEKNMRTERRTHPYSYNELMNLFNYSKRSIFRILKEGSISREGRSEKEKDCIIPSPSRELAWFIGILSSRGFSGTRMFSCSSPISRSNSKDFLDTFRSVGENLFKMNAAKDTTKEKAYQGGRRIYKDRVVEFHSSKAGGFLGDLRKSIWPQTILEKHPWILANQEYGWGFIEGYFDGHGGIYEGQGNRVILTSPSRNACFFLLELLVKLGIKEPKLQTKHNSPEGISGVVLSRIDDARTFAQNCHSQISRKEEFLQYYRQREAQRNLKRNKLESRPTNQSILEEWQRLRTSLGHVPTWNEIMNLKQLTQTKYSPNIYSTHFGATNENKSRGSFPLAVENLERTLLERTSDEDINELLKSYEYATGIQIKYVPKVHRDWRREERAKSRLEELFSEIGQEL